MTTNTKSHEVDKFIDLATKIFDGTGGNKSAKVDYFEKKFGSLPLGDICEVVYLPAFDLGLLNTEGATLLSVKNTLLDGGLTEDHRVSLKEIYERLCSYSSGQERGNFPGMPCAYINSDLFIGKTMRNASEFITVIERMNALSSSLTVKEDDEEITLYNEVQDLYKRVVETAIPGWIELLSDIEGDFTEMGI